MSWELALQAGLLGYILGGLPFGYWLLWVAESRDVRKEGSGNTGATNVLRTGSKGLAALTLFLDVSKGFSAVVLAAYLWPTSSSFVHVLWSLPSLSVIAGVAAVLGHVFSPFLKFQGGKGIATYLGVLLALSPWTALASLGVWCIGFFWSRRSSVASLLAVLLSPAWVWYFNGGLSVDIAIGMALFLFWTHRSNIVRLWQGEEKPLF